VVLFCFCFFCFGSLGWWVGRTCTGMEGGKGGREKLKMGGWVVQCCAVREY